MLLVICIAFAVLEDWNPALADKGSPYREACEWSTGMSDGLSKLDGDVGTNTGIAAFLDWHRKYVNDKTIDDANRRFV